jgi:hypothetical protein
MGLFDPNKGITGEKPHVLFNAESQRIKPGQYIAFIVEDNETESQQMISALKSSPYIAYIYHFRNGDSLLAELTAEEYRARQMELDTIPPKIPIIIFLDLRMSGTDGLDILRELREHPLTKTSAIIITTPTLSYHEFTESYQLRANAYLPKPLRLDNLHALIYNGWNMTQTWMDWRIPHCLRDLRSPLN